MRRRRLIPAGCVFLLLLAAPSFAQTGTGRISGLVKDSTGAIVPGVTILAVHEETGIRHEPVTTEAGLFLFPSLPVGPYTLRAELSGFRPISRAERR
jgi:hypothetical protein